MNKRLRRIALAILALYVLWKLLGGILPGPRPRSVEHLADRVWVDRLPTGPRDAMNALLLVKRANQGVFWSGSEYRHTIDVFGWKLEQDHLELLYLQDETRHTYTARTWACAGEAPRPFDLCLELTCKEGTRRYYSARAWEQARGGAPFIAEEAARVLGTAERSIASGPSEVPDTSEGSDTSEASHGPDAAK